MKQDQSVKFAHVGVDVSKGSLQIDAGDLYCGEIANNAKAVAALVRDLRKKAGGKAEPLYCMESTGCYSGLALDAFARAGAAATILNPCRVRDYARSMSVAAKTDRVDAWIIRRFADVRNPRPAAPANPVRAEIRQLVRKRKSLQDDITRLGKQDGAPLLNTFLRKRMDRIVKLMEDTVAGIDRELERLRHADPVVGGLSDVFMAEYGVATLSAVTVAVEVPEIGFLTRRRVAGILGLAPHPRDSGGQSDQRHVSGGRKVCRCALYMPALASGTHPKGPLHGFYGRLRKAGKSHSQASVAVMRKLAVRLNSLAREWWAGHPEAEVPAPYRPWRDIHGEAVA